MPSFPVAEFMETQIQKLADRARSHLAMSNNASALGHGCLRYLVYRRTIGDQAVPPTPEKQALFDEGKLQEDVAIDLIRRTGYRYERGQEMFGVADLEIRGQMEGIVIKLDDTGRQVGKWAAEIKKVEDWTFDSLNTWEQLLQSPWHFRWLVQLQLAIYHVMSKEGWDDCGVLFLKHTSRAIVKPISVPFNLEVLNTAFERAKQINANIKAGTVPDRCEYTKGLCTFCEYAHICQPDEAFIKEAGENITDQEFIAKLERRAELEASGAEYRSLDKEVKTVLKGKPYAIAGPFRIQGKANKAGAWLCTIDRVMDAADAEAVKTIGGV